MGEPIAPPCGREGVMWENCIMHCCCGGMCQCAFGAMGPMAWPFAVGFNLSPIVALFMRSRTREKYGIAGSKAMDCCCHYVCCWCALSQEYEELKKRIPAPPGHKWRVYGLLEDDEPTPA